MNRFGEVDDAVESLSMAINYLQLSLQAAKNWESGVCHKNGLESSWVKCGGPQENKEKCCVSEDNPPRVRTAIRILSKVRDKISSHPEARISFLSGLTTLESFFGTSSANFTDDAGYSNSTWSSTISTISSALNNLETAYAILSGRFKLYVIIGVSVSIMIALIYYFK